MIRLKCKMKKLLRSSIGENPSMRKQLSLTKAAVQSDWILMIWLDNWEWAGMKETGRKLWRPTHYLDSTRLDFTRPQFSFSNIADYLCWPSLVFFSLFTWLSELVEQLYKCTVFNTLLYSTHCCTHRFSSTHVIWLHIPVLIFTQPSTVSCWRLIGGSDWCSPPAAHEEFSHGSGFLNTAALKIHLSHTSHCPSNHDDNAFQHITI